MAKVVSSNVHSVGHDVEKQELHVRFHSGDTYVYRGVSADKHKELMGAQSVGAHLNKHVKPHHSWKKLEQEKKHHG